MKVTLYTDGASRGNLGQAGLGVVIYAEDGQKIAELCEYLGSTTNNIAEYKADQGIGRSQGAGATEVEVFTDSELMAANKWTIQSKMPDLYLFTKNQRNFFFPLVMLK